MKIIQLLPLFFVATWLVSCATKVPQSTTQNAPAPAENYQYSSQQVKSQDYLSSINIPIDISIAEIEKQLNKQVNGLIYEDNSPTDNNNDQLLAKVWKRAAIGIQPLADAHIITIPLKFWINANINPLKMLAPIYRELEFAIDISFQSKLSVSPDWVVSTQTQYAGFDWVTKPVLRIAGFDIPVDGIVGKILASNAEKITKGIDDAVRQNIELKKHVLTAWNLASKPVLIHEKYKTWLKVTPVSVSMSPLKTIGNHITAVVNVSAQMQSFFGEKPSTVSTNAIPALKIAEPSDDNFTIGLVGELSHTEALRILKDTIVGQKFDNGATYAVTVTGVDLYGNENNIVIKADLMGSINGSIYFKGVPAYDPTRKAIYLKDFDYDLQTKNFLLKTANWLLQGRFAKQLEGYFVMPISTQLIDTQKELQGLLNQNQVAKGILLTGKVAEITPEKVYLTPNSIIAVFLCKGKMNLKIEGLD